MISILDMLLEFLVSAIPIISVIYVIVGIKLFKKIEDNKVNSFSLLMFACAIYSFGYYLELNCVSFSTFLLVRNFEFFGVSLVPTFGILFVSELTKLKISKRVIIMLCSFSAMLWLTFITNPIHSLMYYSIELETIRGLAIAVTTKGPLFYLLLAYIASFLLFSILSLFKAYRAEKGEKRRSSLLFVLFSFQLPWIMVLIIVFGFDKYIDPSPATIMIVSILFLINEVKNGMFELQIKSWKSTFLNIGEPAFLVNKLGEIICSNVNADIFFREHKKSIKDIIACLDESELNNKPSFFTINNEIKWFNIKKNVFDAKSEYINYLLIDITAKKDISLVAETFFNSIEEFIFIGTEDGKILFVNNEVRKRLEYSDEDIMQMNVIDFHPTDVREEAIKIFNKMMNREENSCPFPLQAKNGNLIPVETRIWQGEWNGNSVFYAMCKDITLFKETEEKFSKLFFNNPAIMAISDLPSHKFIDINDAFVTTLGYSRDEVIGKTAKDLNMFYEETQYNKSNKKLELEGTFSNVEASIRAKNDNHLTGLFSGEIIQNNNSTQLLSVMIDITENKKKDELLEVVMTITQDFLKVHNYIDAVPKAFKLLGEVFDVSRVYLFENKFDEKGNITCSSQKIEWCSENSSPQIDNPSLQNVPAEILSLFLDPLSKGENYILNIVDLEEGYTKSTLEAQDIRSILALPIMISDYLWGFVGFDECRHERLWTEMEQDVLKVFVSSLKKAIERKHIDEILIQSEEKIKAILNAIPDMFFIFSPDGTIMDYYSSNDTNFLINPELFLNKNIRDIMPEDIALQTTEKIKTALDSMSIQIYEYSFDAEEPEYFEARLVPINKDLVLSISRDISERKRLEIELSQEKKLLETTLISVGDGVISTDDNGNIVFINRIAELLTGWTQDTAKGKPIEDVFNIVDECTGKKSINMVEQVIKVRQILELSNHTILISKDGKKIPIEDSAAPIFQEDGKIIGVVLVFRDCSIKKQKQAEIEYLSYHDQLTGLYNRRYFDDVIKKFDDEKFLPLTLVMVDVNGLKLTNDAFGHNIGDALLKKVANILKEECQTDDVVARIGGDEFVLLMPNTNEKKADEIINQINTSISNEKINNIVLSISIGMDIKKDNYDDINEVFKKAENKMYKHKLSESSSMRSKTIDLIMNTLYEKNTREMQHSKRVSELCEAIATKMNFEKDSINQIRIAGLMHDIGKIGIDEKILNKNQRLNKDEWNEMQRHSEIGYRILSSVNEFSEIAGYVLEHHERWDGNGYPKGLKQEEISLQARIIAIADAFDAMTSDRTYRLALSEEQAVSELKKYSGIQYDPYVVDIFLNDVLRNIISK